MRVILLHSLLHTNFLTLQHAMRPLHFQLCHHFPHSLLFSQIADPLLLMYDLVGVFEKKYFANVHVSVAGFV
ncbi:hypothetical protein BJ741DRAFT_621761, partial [Chytriomyces cf. hyalinus JEL632]